MANDTEAPSGNTPTAIQSIAKTGLSLDELDFCTLIEQQYTLGHGLISEERAYELYRISPSSYRTNLGSSKVCNYLAQRGINVQFYKDAADNPEGFKSSILTPVQMVVINTMLDLTDQRSKKKKLNDLGISTRQWSAWLSDPTFVKYYQDRAETILDNEGVAAARLALMDKIESGDVNAIKLLLEIKKLYTPGGERASGESQVAINFQIMMVKIVEIINEEVEGDVAVRIADRFKTLLAANNLAAQLLEEEENEIHVPVVAKARELTPAMQALMDKTGGNT